MAHDMVLLLWRGHVDGCIFLPSANRTQLTCVSVSICVCCIEDTNRQRPTIVPPMVYLHLTQAVAWCEM